MDLQDHLSIALQEERRANACRLNHVRLAGIGAFFLSVVVLGLLSSEPQWREMLIGTGVYFGIALVLSLGSAKSPRILRLSRFAVPAFDMPMVFAIQMINIQGALAGGSEARPYSEFAVSLFVCLLMLSAFTMNSRFVLISLGVAIVLEQFLQSASGTALYGRVFSTIVLALSAWICAYAGKNRLSLVQNVARANARRLRLQRYFSPGVGQMLEGWDEDEMSDGRECELTIMFIDIRGFTALSEAMPSRDVVELLNSYHSHMVEAIFRNGGTLDKYLGDGLIAYFNAPVNQADHAVRAVNCALDMRKELKILNERRAKEGKPPIRMGIGIHTGGAIVGDIGAPHRREFTAIGSAVNVASRLEGMSKKLDRTIVVSKATAEMVKETEWVDLGSHEIRGAKEPIELMSPARSEEKQA